MKTFLHESKWLKINPGAHSMDFTVFYHTCSIKKTQSYFFSPILHSKSCNFLKGLPVWEGQQNNAKSVLCKPYLRVRYS